MSLNTRYIAYPHPYVAGEYVWVDTRASVPPTEEEIKELESNPSITVTKRHATGRTISRADGEIAEVFE